MQLGTIRTDDGTTAVRVDGDEAVLLSFTDVGEILREGSLAYASRAEGERVPLAEVSWAPVVIEPNKVICVGMNYADHVAEMGNVAPAHPPFFAKFSGSLIGAYDDIHLPRPELSVQNDWEAELCVVIGEPAREVSPNAAINYVAGYTAMNDFSVRDWQNRTSQFLTGKTFEHATALGPVMTTTDQMRDGSGLRISSSVNGEVKQLSNTSELIFDVPFLVSELSKVITLLPGDVIATGTPGGVGAGRDPQEWLANGDEVSISIEGIGEIRNRCVLPL